MVSEATSALDSKRGESQTTGIHTQARLSSINTDRLTSRHCKSATLIAPTEDIRLQFAHDPVPPGPPRRSSALDLQLAWVFFFLFGRALSAAERNHTRSVPKQRRGLDNQRRGLDSRGAEPPPFRSKPADMSSTGTTEATICLLPAHVASHDEPPFNAASSNLPHTTSQPADEPLTSTAINDNTPHDSAKHIKTESKQTAKVKQKQPSLNRTFDHPSPNQTSSSSLAAFQPPQWQAGNVCQPAPNV